MANEAACPFDEPLPDGRETMEVPIEIRQELASLMQRKREFTGKKLSRMPSIRAADESFGGYYAASSQIVDRLNEIERTILNRPQQARIAFHSDWKYSIETPQVLEREMVNGKKS